MLTFFIVIYLLLTLAVGFWASRRIKLTEDFTLAGRSLPATVVGVTIFATWFGPELIMGVPTYFIQEGVQGIIIDQFGNFLCLTLVGLFYARRLYRMRIVTINDFFRQRYTPAIETVTSLINVFTYFSWIAAQFVALALLFKTIIGLPLNWGIILGATIVVIYTYIGGMWAVSITDLIQTVLIIAGLLFLLIKLLDITGGITPVLAATPEGFFRLLPEPGIHNWLDYLNKWMILGIGAIPAQEIYQRILSARSGKAGAHGALISGGMLFVIGAIPLLIALSISQVYPALLQDSGGQNMIPNMVSRYTEMPVQILFFGALISAILSTSSGAMLAPATVIGENLIKPRVPGITDKQLLLFTRLCVIFVAVIACTMAYFNSSIHGLVVDSVTLYLVCLVVPFSLGLFWRKASIAGAWAAMIVGLLVYALCVALETRIDAAMQGLLASLLAMVAVSWLRPDTSFAAFQKNQTAA